MMSNDQATQDYDDIYAGLSDEILKNIFIRFYTMEDYFQFQALPESKPAPSDSSNMQGQNQPKKVIPVFMLYNRIIQECICDLFIMNKLVCSKAKLVHSILDNGRSICMKKNESWTQFIKQPGFEKVALAYELMPDYKKDMIKYSVLSISNLLLKLSINMSKVSVIPIQKFLNFQCLNIPTLSVAFLQNLQCRLFNSKNITDGAQKLSFMRQLPKITYIKLSKYKNNTELELLETSQHQFISSKVDQVVKNLQYIEIHEQSEDPIMKQYKRKTKYPHMHCFDLNERTQNAVKAPYEFQILEIMRQVVFPLVKEFKPDEIVYMESYPNGTIVMNDQIRGLMLCEMAEETTCNKMYVFKEMGMEKMDIKKYAQAIQQEGQIISKNINEILLEEQKRIGRTIYQKGLIKPQDKKNINKLKKIFMDQLCFTSLALIQKTSFENIRQKSHRQFFDQRLLNCILKMQEQLMKNPDLTASNLKSKMQGVKMMKEVLQFRNKGQQNAYKIIDLYAKQECFKSFYNIHEQREQMLEAYVEGENTPREFYYKEDDNIIIKYCEKRLLVIIIRYDGDKIEFLELSKNYGEKQMKVEALILWDCEENYLEGATYVCSNQYLYRGFGKHRRMKEPGQDPYNKNIHRIPLTPEAGKKWQLVATHAIVAKPAQKEQPKSILQRKVHGYGIFDSDNRAILMMGGYVDSYNEERISKNLYYIKNADLPNTGKADKDGLSVSVMGKTNKIVYNTSNDKIKDVFLYPFVFGIPFVFGAAPAPFNPPTTSTATNSSTAATKGAFVLNSNGNYLNLNHNNKIFTSLIKLSSITIYNGISMQNKLKISEDIDEGATSIFLSEVLIKCLVFYPHQINMKGNVCCVQTLEEGRIIMEASLVDKSIAVSAPQIFQENGEPTWRKIRFV